MSERQHTDARLTSELPGCTRCHTRLCFRLRCCACGHMQTRSLSLGSIDSRVHMCVRTERWPKASFYEQNNSVLSGSCDAWKNGHQGSIHPSRTIVWTVRRLFFAFQWKMFSSSDRAPWSLTWDFRELEDQILFMRFVSNQTQRRTLLWAVPAFNI